jgi:predicted  nucleic acid-binding Zn-ribbon protein
MPEHAEIDGHDRQLQRLRDLVVGAETDQSDLTREQTKADGDVEQVRRRSARDQQRLDSGQVSAPRELEQLQHEIATLGRRQSELEDIELEIMERLEAAGKRLAQLRTEQSQIQEQRAIAVARRDGALAEIDAEAARCDATRTTLTGQIAADLVALYDKIRAQQAGIGAAQLVRRQCTGCRLELNTIDLGRLRAAAPTDVLRCEECGRILVRTAESGI